MYDLPKSVTLGDKEYKIRSDYRAILDICMALNDPELDNENKVHELLTIFYEDEIPAKDWQEAVDKCLWFMNCGEKETGKKRPKLMDWEQDFKYIVPAVNRVLGGEIRALDYLHWWSFMGAYNEIGDCLFAHIVRIRELKAKGKLKEKQDKEWYREHRDLVDFKTNYTSAEEELLKQWGV